MSAILLLFHCESNTGYAIGKLEKTFFEVALQLMQGDASRVHVAYPSMEKGPSKSLPPDFRQYLIVDSSSRDPSEGIRIADYLATHNIQTIFGFDQPASRPMYRYFREGGVKNFIAYWGAPVSSIFSPLKRSIRRLEMSLRHEGPDHYIFESQGMADTAVLGRGIPKERVHVVNIGVDESHYYPDAKDADYVYSVFDIPRHRKVFFYSGHMEKRKGVEVIMRSALELANSRPDGEWHFVLLGNQPGEESPYIEMLKNSPAADHVTFGGYRTDLARLHRGCYAGVIASTGWDSFTVSAIEMQASGLPVLVSNLPGLNESVENQVTGLLFEPGDALCLSRLMMKLLDDVELRNRLGEQARLRVLRELTVMKQKASLVQLMENVVSDLPETDLVAWEAEAKLES